MKLVDQLNSMEHEQEFVIAQLFIRLGISTTVQYEGSQLFITSCSVAVVWL